MLKLQKAVHGESRTVWTAVDPLEREKSISFYVGQVWRSRHSTNRYRVRTVHFCCNKVEVVRVVPPEHWDHNEPYYFVPVTFLNMDRE